MSEKKANEIINWINFGISCLGIIAKFVKEIIETLPKKAE